MSQPLLSLRSHLPPHILKTNHTLPNALKLLTHLHSLRHKQTPNAKAKPSFIELKIHLQNVRAAKQIMCAIELPRECRKEIATLAFVNQATAERWRKKEETEEMQQGGGKGIHIVGTPEKLIPLLERGEIGKFKQVIAQPQVMQQVAKAGRILGPMGLFPSTKRGTVTDDVEKMLTGDAQTLIQPNEAFCIVVRVGLTSNPEASEKVISTIIKKFLQIHDLPGSAQVKTLIKHMYLTSCQGPSFRLDMKSLGIS